MTQPTLPIHPSNQPATAPTPSLEHMLATLQTSLSLTPAELARLLHVSLVTINRWSRGVGQPSINQLQQIADFFNAHRDSRPTPTSNAFSSTRATRQPVDPGQANLFHDHSSIQLTETPGPRILQRIKTGRFFPSPSSIQHLLSRHSHPANTPAAPVATSVSAGKNTYTYDAHTYHTKVPPQGILELLKHYLPSGGLVLDPFAGSGMTGVASRIGGYDVILNELSPAACFIAHNFTEAIQPDLFVAALDKLLTHLAPLRRELYRTTCRECHAPVEANYHVWSYRVLCYHCDASFLLWDHSRKYGRTVRDHKILTVFPCPSCGTTLKKRKLTRTSAEPVLIAYKCCTGAIRQHPLNDADLHTIASVENSQPIAPGFSPTTDLPDGVNLSQPKRHGLTSVDRFYTTRNLTALSHIWRAIHCIPQTSLASAMAFVFTSLYQRVSRLSEYRFWGGSGNTARFNVPFIFNEANVFLSFQRKANTILAHLEATASHYAADKAIVCGSATDMHYLPDNSVDLIFTDPPFGANINYSEMNILWESWLGEYTDPTNEVIINRCQRKGPTEYGQLMTASLTECHRVLRDGHWLLVVFMNSSATVWRELRHSLRQAGFVLERADIFDKQHGTFKQFVSPNTAGYDLVIHCRKVSGGSGSLKKVAAVASADESIREFVTDYKDKTPTTIFLHVSRDEEIDYRLMYSDWLSYAVVHGHELCDLEAFRKMAIDILAGKSSNDTS